MNFFSAPRTLLIVFGLYLWAGGSFAVTLGVGSNTCVIDCDVGAIEGIDSGAGSEGQILGVDSVTGFPTQQTPRPIAPDLISPNQIRRFEGQALPSVLPPTDFLGSPATDFFGDDDVNSVFDPSQN